MNGVLTTLGEWSRELKFTVVNLDDFKPVVGLDFFKATKVDPLLHLRSVLIPRDKSCLVKAIPTIETERKSKGPYVSAMKLRIGVIFKTLETARPRGKD